MHRRRLTTGWTTALALAAALSAASGAAAPADTTGETLYRHGVLRDGRPLRGVREGNASVEGAGAACVVCHRRSGLGSTEGQITIPPITGPHLYRPSVGRIDAADVHFVGGSRVRHEAYTDETLARAIRQGVGSDGRSLSYLMPRYELDDTTMAALIGYLKGMAPRHVPGVTDTVLHFATIITPDADPLRRKAMLDVLDQYFADKNAAARFVAPRMYASRPMEFKVNRRWQLHVWSLSGAPATWQAQLRAHLAAEPVFAVISGLGGKTWEPVHRFCEQESLPCLFPNVDVPVVDDGDFYTVYFSQGVLLEARLIARGLRTEGAAPQRVVQVLRARDAGEPAAAALRAQLAGTGIPVENRVLRDSPASASELRAALEHVGARDALVLWLRGEDLANLPDLPASAPAVWVSGLLGGLDEAPLPPSWREAVHMSYPLDLPDKRRVRVDYALGWFRLRRVPVVAPRLQTDTYLACGLLAEVLGHMVETFERDYLLERFEEDLDHRVLTGYYPHLTLSPGQRFASKGGYTVHFAAGPAAKLVADAGWSAP